MHRGVLSCWPGADATGRVVCFLAVCSGLGLAESGHTNLAPRRSPRRRPARRTQHPPAQMKGSLASLASSPEAVQGWEQCSWPVPGGLCEDGTRCPCHAGQEWARVRALVLLGRALV